MEEYNTDIPGSGWRFTYSMDSNGASGENGINEVSFERISDGAPGWTYQWYDFDSLISLTKICYYKEAIQEADIYFNSNYNWSSDLTMTTECFYDPDTNTTSGICNLKDVALHELGHAAGLQHENRVIATMGVGGRFGLNRNLFIIHADDKAGMRSVYGDGTTGTDVAVHAFKQISTVGEYGDVGDVNQSTSLTDPALPYAELEFTLENHGTYTEDVEVSFYIFNNNTWQSLGSTKVSGIPSGYVGTMTRFLYIPSVPAGNYRFKVRVDPPYFRADAKPLNNEFEYLRTIYINYPPVLDSIGSKIVNEGQTLSFSISASDPNGDSLTYGAVPLPSGAIFNEQIFSWTPGFDQAGVYSVTFVARDPGGLDDLETMAITVADGVNQPPVLAAIGNRSVSAENNLAFTISATNPDGGTLTYSATGLPAGATFNASTRVFSWTPTSSQAGNNYYVTFTVSDGSLTDTEVITITAGNAVVDNPPTAPGTPKAPSPNNGTFTVTWTASTDASGIAYYRVYRGGATGDMSLINTGVPTNSYKESNLAVGKYRYLVVAVDSSGRNSESPISAVIEVVPADLVMTAVSGPAGAATGTTISIADTVKNQGPVSASSFYTGFYLSTDAAITTTDRRIGTRGISSLAAGASNSATTTVTVPATLATGTYYIGAIADYANTVTESSETNNARAGNTLVVR